MFVLPLFVNLLRMPLNPTPEMQQRLGRLELLANQAVEGFITGLHKSPFHGFSVEFAEHRLYNPGESTKHIDWKLYAARTKCLSNDLKKKQIFVAKL